MDIVAIYIPLFNDPAINVRADFIQLLFTFVFYIGKCLVKGLATFCVNSMRTLIPFMVTNSAIKLLFSRPHNILQRETAMVLQLSNFSSMQEDGILNT